MTPLAPSRILLLITSAALVAGTTQIVSVVIRRQLFDQFTFTSRDIFWMAPLSSVMLLAPLTVGLIIVSRITSRRVAQFVAAWVSAFYVTYATVLLFPQLHPIAIALLSIGVAQSVARSIEAKPETWFSRLVATSIRLAITLAALAVATVAWRATEERRAFSSLPPAAATAPNVLLLVLDTVRAASLDVYGAHRATAPQIRQRAAEGALFEWAIATSSWTLPSHGSMFTGRRPDELSARFLVPLDGHPPLLAERLRDRGYATAGFVANLNYTGHESGLQRGLGIHSGYRRTPREALLQGMVTRTPAFRDMFRSLTLFRSPRGAMRAVLGFEFFTTVRFPYFHRKNATYINDEFLAWQGSLRDRPFFAFLNYFDAHISYDPKPALRTKFASDPRRFVPIDLYEASIASIDEELGRLFDELARRGVLDRTIVVITSDHGEQFGEHGLMEHGNSLYTQVLRVPLVVRYPPIIAAGTRVREAVSLQDLPATILQLAEVPASHIGGMSLVPLIHGRPSSARSPVIAELEDHVKLGGEHIPESRSIMDDSWHYITAEGAPDQLYAYRTDPAEERNLADSQDGVAAIARLAAELRNASSPQPYRTHPKSPR